MQFYFSLKELIGWDKVNGYSKADAIRGAIYSLTKKLKEAEKEEKEIQRFQDKGD